MLECTARIDRLGKETKLIVGGKPQQGHHDPALIKAVVRALRWFEWLKSRKVQSIAEIATREGLQRAYVSSLMPLSFLAPDITEMILQGRQPVGITLDRILRLKPLPADWDAQRSFLGLNG